MDSSVFEGELFAVIRAAERPTPEVVRVHVDNAALVVGAQRGRDAMLLDTSPHRSPWRRLAVACLHKSLYVLKIKEHMARPDEVERGWRWQSACRHGSQAHSCEVPGGLEPRLV
eukprot:1870817-Amphidinium_carterae.1